MDLLKNPFYILGATTRDNRHRIIALEEERSLLGDADECMSARATLITPRRRISAEVGWLPGADPDFADLVLNQVESASQNLLNITGLTPIARANLLVSGLSRLPTPWSSNLVEWIQAIAESAEAINSDLLRSILNIDRRASGFPEITDMTVIADEIRKQRGYYSQTVTSVLEGLLVNERVNVMTLIVETSTRGGRYPPILIKDLVTAYELGVQGPLAQSQKIIEAQDTLIREIAAAESQDTTLARTVAQLLGTLRDWDRLVQPIQLSQRSTGVRHNASFEMAMRFRQLAADLFIENRKSDFSRKILNTLQDMFAEIPEIAENLAKDSRELEEQINFVRIVERIEEIQSQVKKLEASADARKPDYTLTPIVHQLIQTLKTWQPSTHPTEANLTVAYTVRNIALHLWNEHQKLDFAIQITETLSDIFRGVPEMDEVNQRLSEDIVTLNTIRRRMKSSNDGCRDKLIGYAVMGVIFLILVLIGALS